MLKHSTAMYNIIISVGVTVLLEVVVTICIRTAMMVLKVMAIVVLFCKQGHQWNIGILKSEFSCCIRTGEIILCLYAWWPSIILHVIL